MGFYRTIYINENGSNREYKRIIFLYNKNLCMNFSNVEDEILILMVQFMVFYLYEQCCETEFNHWIEER